jgi:hypothetical protein
VYGANWKYIKEFNVDFSDFTLNKGENSLNVDCDFIQPDKKATVKFEIRTVEKQEKIVLNI